METRMDCAGSIPEAPRCGWRPIKMFSATERLGNRVSS